MKNEASLKEIGNNIQIARLKKKLTQEALAEKCNVSQSAISQQIKKLVLMYSLLKHLQFI